VVDEPEPEPLVNVPDGVAGLLVGVDGTTGVVVVGELGGITGAEVGAEVGTDFIACSKIVPIKNM